MQNPDAAASSGVTQAQAWDGEWGYRFKRASANTIDLEEVGPASAFDTFVIANGITTAWDISTQNAMTNAGASTGATVASSVSTIFGVYWCQAGAFSGGVGFSTSAPVRVDGSYRLNSSGDGLSCLFLGWIRTSAAGALVDTVQDRHVVNYWNRRQATLELCPGYTNDNAVTTYTKASATWTTIGASAAASAVSFLANGEDAYDVFATFVTQSSAVNPDKFGLGISTTQPVVTCSASANAGNFRSASCRQVAAPSNGLVTVSMLTVQQGGSTATFVADFARDGAASDPPATYIRGLVWA